MCKFEELINGDRLKIAVIGLGYVGLPLALSLSEKFNDTVGFDISADKISRIRDGIDPTNEGFEERIRSSSLRVASNPNILSGANVFIISVPTPIDSNKQPNLKIIQNATETIAKYLTLGSVVVVESTVFPTVTEEFCGPILERLSGLKRGIDFKLGYSPERINAGDAENSLTNVIKIIAGEDDVTVRVLEKVYGAIIKPGLYKASSIQVAEAAKVIENTQRDLNIALVNELAIIFERMNICTQEVLKAAGTKWNFLKFQPGLVGGHCIGVDPYYLTAKAKSLGYHPEVILAGRRINDSMGNFIAQKLIKLLIKKDKQIQKVRVGIIGLAFKENVSDIRNSRVPDIYNELLSYGVEAKVYDPNICPKESSKYYNINISSLEEMNNLDGLILAVPHKNFTELDYDSLLVEDGVFIDVKSKVEKETFSDSVSYWSL